MLRTRIGLLGLLAWTACASPNRPVPEAPAPAEPRFGDTPDEQSVYRALSARDPAPDCAEIEAGVDRPVPILVRVAEEAEAPPWAPLRAAGCLVQRHGEAAEDHLRDWVVDPARAGLAELVLERVDLLPEPVAVEVVRDALDGPHREAAEAAAAASERPEIRAVFP